MQPHDDDAPPPPRALLARDSGDPKPPPLVFRHLAHLHLQVAWYYLRAFPNRRVNASVAALKQELFEVDVTDPASEFALASLLTRLDAASLLDPQTAEGAKASLAAARSWLFPHAPAE